MMTPQAHEPPLPSPPRAACRAALALILLAAAALRFCDLGDVPPGLWFDEALNGQDAAAVWQPGGHFRIVYPAEFPREPMFETLLALAARAFGPRVVVMRAVAALLGTLTVLLLYLMLRGEAGEGLALGAAAALAAMRWHVIFSRIILRTIILPPWLILIVWAALALRRRPSAARALLLGALVGGGFYTYLAWYFMLPMVGVLLAALALGWMPGGGEASLAAPRARRLPATQIPLALAAAALVALPLAVHYLRLPADLLSRPDAVSPWIGGIAAGLRAVGKNALEALGMFHWRGDHVPMQNIPRRAALDPLQGVLLLWGLWLCVRGARRGALLGALLPLWLACGMLATILTKTDSPNFLRTLCLTPAVAALVGWGLADAGGRLARRTGPARAAGAAALLVALSLALTTHDVFFDWARRGDVWQRFKGGIVQLARAAAAAPDGVDVFVPRQLEEDRTFQFLMLTAPAAPRVHAYSDWSMLAPWPQAPHAPGRPAPRERWIVVTARTPLALLLHDAIPRGRVAQTFDAPPQGFTPLPDGRHTWAAVFAVAETDLPASPTLARLRAQYAGPMDF